MVTEQHKRIAKNTLMLYARQMVTLLIGLYTVRVTLEVIGVTDFGIYNAVAGVVALLMFLSASMASATQRFFSFALGSADSEKLHKIFTTNWVTYAAIGLGALLVLETAGLWFVSYRLQVPAEMLGTVLWVYQLSVAALVLTIICTPFTAMLIAHEDMQIYAYVSIAETVMRLGAVLLLIVLPGEKLVLYALLLLLVTLLKTIFYATICTVKYPECQFRKFHWDRRLFREIFGFTGWTLFGQFTTALRTQAITVLLNQMFNPAIVAAKAIATGASTQLGTFAGNFNTGLYPPIIKSYASGDHKEMFSLINNGSKFTFFMMWVFSLPLLLEMGTVLHLWLGSNMPPETVLFARLAIIESLIMSVSLPLATAARAPGKMKLYELTLGSMQISIFFFAWLFLKQGAPAYSVYVVAIVVNVLMFFARLLIVRSLIHMPLRPFFVQVLAPLSLVAGLSLAASLAISHLLPPDLLCRGVAILASVFFSTVCMYYIGLNKSLRARARALLTNKINKVLGTSFA